MAFDFEDTGTEDALPQINVARKQVRAKAFIVTCQLTVIEFKLGVLLDAKDGRSHYGAEHWMKSNQVLERPLNEVRVVIRLQMVCL